MMKKVHVSHLGINACLRRARDLICCRVCLQRSARMSKRVVIAPDMERSKQLNHYTYKFHEIPTLPWENVGSDMFTWASGNYLVTVDYHGKFWELDYLPDTTSATSIKKIKHHFVREGIPHVLISCNRLQYTSAMLANFRWEWNFGHESWEQ